MLNTASLFDLSPAWRILALGALLALGPALWVIWRRRSPVRALQALAVLTLFLTLDLVMFGAFTRLTDSGLGCPDWPGCYGNGSPLGASVQIGQAEQAMPGGPVTEGKAWIEMLHRYLATAVGALILLMCVWQYRQRRVLAAHGARWGWSLAALVWVCVQGAFGALTVTMKLFPAIVTLHLLGALVLLALLSVVTVQLRWVGATAVAEKAVPIAWRRWWCVALAVLLCQAALGAWVSSNYAVLACPDFPSCQGDLWWPAMDFARGFELWRPLGRGSDGAFVSLDALTAVHVTHRVFALFVVLLLGALLLRWPRADVLRRARLALGGLLMLQVLTGIGNVVLAWPLIGAVLHTGGAGGLVMVLVWMLAGTQAAGVARRRR